MWDNCYLLHYYSHTKSPSKRGTLTHGPLNATGAWFRCILIWYLIRVYIHVTLKWKRILFLVSQSQKHKTLAGFRRCKIWSWKRNISCFESHWLTRSLSKRGTLPGQRPLNTKHAGFRRCKMWSWKRNVFGFGSHWLTRSLSKRGTLPGHRPLNTKHTGFRRCKI